MCDIIFNMKKVLTKKEKVLDFIDKYWLYFFVGLMALLCFACFVNLSKLPIEDWDEARHGINAYEMLKEGNFVVNFYQGELDYWNLKPPISYWAIILGYKLFGFNAFGLRFFSALSYVLTALIVSLFLKKKFGKLESLISVLFFLSFSYMFIMHCVRSGDADAIFLLFYAVGVVALFLSTENSNWLFLVGGVFAFAFLTKSWHAGIFIPMVFFYLLFTKGFKKIKWWQYIVFILVTLAPIGLWGILRYNFDGMTFFKQMFEYDLLNRSANAIENHNGTIFYYFLLLGLIPTMLIAVVCGVIQIVIKIKNKEKLSPLAVLCLSSFLTTFIMFSIAKTKLGWYVYPCTIPSAIAGSFLISKWLKNLSLEKTKKQFRIMAFVFTIFVGVFSLLTLATPFVTISEMNTTSQTFIKNLDTKSAEIVYMQEKENSTWGQANLLLFEFNSGKIGLNGGYDEFIKHHGSYLIIDKPTFETIDKTSIEIVSQDENWLFIKNIMQ